MRHIDIHNYEAYLLDFSEGNLTGELQVELELFLIQHPELEINLEDISLASVEEEATLFADKNSLKKSDTDLVSETQFISYIENQLSKDEVLELEKSCVINPSLSKELALYTSTLAKADMSILFENKQSLKRKPKVIWFNFSGAQYAAAACVVFLIGLYMLWPKTNIDSETSTLANKTNVVNTNTTTLNNNEIIQPITNSNELAASKESNANSVKRSIATKAQQPLLANNSTNRENNTYALKDTLHSVIHNVQEVESPKNETLIALNATPVIKPKTVVQVITENDDEAVAVNTEKKKKGIWAAASRALKNLNHAGVKTVNGDEDANNDSEAYALTLGGVSITHKAGL